MVDFLENLLKPKAGEQKKELYELDWEGVPAENKVHFKTIGIERYSDTDEVIDAMRDKRNIILMKIKTKMAIDKTEVRRAIRRVQKSCFAAGGDIVGLAEDMILVTPPFVVVEREEGEQISATKTKARILAEES